MKDDNLDFSDISTKHLTLRIILFALAVAVAVAAFVYGIKKLGGNEAGWSVISARADGDAPRYAVNVRLMYDLEGKSRSIRELKNEIADAYSTALGRLYKLLDAEKDYPGYEGNLADLNKRYNRDVTLPQELFDILYDALERTGRGEGYSIYAAPLYAEWERIAYAADAADFDPRADAGMAERLQAIAAQCSDRENCRLEIVDRDACVVRLHVADAYLDFLSEYELPRILLDLNALHDAYLLRGVAAALEERGFSSGFLYTTGGMTLSLSGHMDGDYVIYSYVNNTAQTAATIPVAPGTACGVFNAFPTEEGEAGFYTAEGMLRCAARPALTGEDVPLRSAFVLRRDGDIAEAAYEAYCAFLTAPQATDCELLAYTPSDSDGKTLFVSGAQAGAVKPEVGFTVRQTDTE